MSTIVPSTPTGYSLFCDDIRQEDNGKQLIIGLYSGDMLVDSFPVLLPNFRVLINYQERPNESEMPVKIVITSPSAPSDDMVIFQADLPRESFDRIQLPTDSDDPFLSIGVNAAFTPIVFTHSGRIKVRAYRGDDEIRLGTLRIRLRSEWEEEQRKAADQMKEAAN
jgi:hypothetical protein